jgi:short-subunit dehydrogenase
MRAVITGGSSGIGLALVHELESRGWEVISLARRGTPSVDVTDAESVREAVNRAGEIDLAIANAGIAIPNHAALFNLADAEQVLRVNVNGMMNLFAAVIPSMIERKRGHFAGVASVAGLRGLPRAGPYSASKAAMQALLEAWRVELKPHNVAVSIINPGFVETDMTAKNRFRMPWLMSAERAARIIADGLAAQKNVIEFPLPMSLLMRTVRFLPDAIYDRMWKE